MTVKVSVRTELNPTKEELSRKQKRGQYAFGNQALQDMNRYAPALNHDMRNTGRMNHDGSQVIWHTVYSRAQFYGTNGIVSFHNYTTPGTGKRWDLKAESIHKRQWEQIIGRAMR